MPALSVERYARMLLLACSLSLPSAVFGQLRSGLLEQTTQLNISIAPSSVLHSDQMLQYSLEAVLAQLQSSPGILKRFIRVHAPLFFGKTNKTYVRQVQTLSEQLSMFGLSSPVIGQVHEFNNQALKAVQSNPLYKWIGVGAGLFVAAAVAGGVGYWFWPHKQEIDTVCIKDTDQKKETTKKNFSLIFGHGGHEPTSHGATPKKSALRTPKSPKKGRVGFKGAEQAFIDHVKGPTFNKASWLSRVNGNDIDALSSPQIASSGSWRHEHAGFNVVSSPSRNMRQMHAVALRSDDDADASQVPRAPTLFNHASKSSTEYGIDAALTQKLMRLSASVSGFQSGFKDKDDTGLQRFLVRWLLFKKGLLSKKNFVKKPYMVTAADGKILFALQPGVDGSYTFILPYHVPRSYRTRRFLKHELEIARAYYNEHVSRRDPLVTVAVYLLGPPLRSGGKGQESISKRLDLLIEGSHPDYIAPEGLARPGLAATLGLTTLEEKKMLKQAFLTEKQPQLTASLPTI